jgi:hypothetical protein
MKLICSLLLLIASVSAFAPRKAVFVQQQSRSPSTFLTRVSEKSLDEEVEEMVQAEIGKTKKMSNLRNEKGVEYAP